MLGHREAYVVWRGISRNYEWLNVLGARPESAEPFLQPKPWEKKNPDDSSSSDEDEDEPRVMNGWLTIYVSNDPNSSFTKLSAREQILAEVNALRDQYKDEDLSITLTGQNLGASLAILSAFDIVKNGVTDTPISAIVFGSPQVGNKAFNERLNKYPNLNVLHIRNEIDLIPLYPSQLLGYSNTGI